MEALTSRFSGNKDSSKKSKNEPEKLFHKCTNRKIEVGWQHFDGKKNSNIVIRLAKGGGSRTMSISLNTSVEELLLLIKSVLFPQDKCTFGKLSNTRFILGDFRSEEISNEDFTVSSYIERHMLSKVKIYLLKLGGDEIIPVSESDSDKVLPCMLGHPCNCPSSCSSGLTGSSEDRKCLRE